MPRWEPDITFNINLHRLKRKYKVEIRLCLFNVIKVRVDRRNSTKQYETTWSKFCSDARSWLVKAGKASLNKRYNYE